MTRATSATPQAPAPASEILTLTTAQLQDLVARLVLKCLDTLGVIVSPDAIAEAVAAQQGGALARQPRELEPARPAPPDPADPSLVMVFVARPLCEQRVNYRPGEEIWLTPQRAEYLKTLHLVVVDPSQVPPAPLTIPSTPEASALSMASVPGMIRRGR